MIKLFSRTHLIICVITFAILFAMNYFGNPMPDKLERALMTAGAGVIGLTAGLWLLGKAKDSDKNPPRKFD